VIPPLDPVEYREIVRRALEEDLGDGDITTLAIVLPTQRAHGVFIAKMECVVAGLDVVAEVFHQLDSTAQLTANHNDGDRSAIGDTIAEVTGSARALIVGERTALNFLQRLSGIATCAGRFVAASGGRITILDTRKTTPNLRVLEKYAVRAGGATNHRRGLFDGILIKDNHIRLAGGVEAAVARTRAFRPGLPIEVEAQTLQQVDEAVAAGAETILIDNMSDAEIRTAVAQVKGHAHIEVSGGIRLERIPRLAETGADFVSVGALTHAAAAIDISFEIEPDSLSH
jgi:nicotinate-nucleotide pyrophosphorylase (carboxylating)